MIFSYPSVMTKVPNSPYRGHRFSAEVIAHTRWLYFRFPLSLRMVEDLLATRVAGNCGRPRRSLT
jgi:transposase-like protein